MKRVTWFLIGWLASWLYFSPKPAPVPELRPSAAAVVCRPTLPTLGGAVVEPGWVAVSTIARTGAELSSAYAEMFRRGPRS